ncbi:hypothetical protein LINPERHAP1_LOCUS28854 [Linum perenne]
MHAPTTQHWQVLKRLLRYLKVTLFHALHFTPTNTTTLATFSDAGWITISKTLALNMDTLYFTT